MAISVSEYTIIRDENIYSVRSYRPGVPRTGAGQTHRGQEFGQGVRLKHTLPGALYSAGMKYYQVRSTMDEARQVTVYNEAATFALLPPLTRKFYPPSTCTEEKISVIIRIYKFNRRWSVRRIKPHPCTYGPPSLTTELNFGEMSAQANKPKTSESELGARDNEEHPSDEWRHPCCRRVALSLSSSSDSFVASSPLHRENTKGGSEPRNAYFYTGLKESVAKMGHSRERNFGSTELQRFRSW
ncbi:unnamed protein product [Bemisia tabaci]|uniref:Uncharacterized protein n=1 Tax=Bemisia tabaci TaxID=7038 RepID=A0A9P0F7R5_BEMTA|nr:unnamed protein product [Bemisia tabaci]